jgi:hypothetical protein
MTTPARPGLPDDVLVSMPAAFDPAAEPVLVGAVG